MYETGMYGGSFNPIHLGHVNNIIKAANSCKKLYVVLSYSKLRDEIPLEVRFRVLKEITKDMENVTIIKVEDNATTKNAYEWQEGANKIKQIIGAPIDAVFAGDDYENTNIFESLYKNSKIVYYKRNMVKISSTQIRNNPYKNWDYIPKAMQAYYVKKVLITGTESCGKSTLVKRLAKYYNTECVEEVGRRVSESVGGVDNMVSLDFLEIFMRHKTLELEKTKTANKVLFIDTDSLVTAYYHTLLLGNNKEVDRLAQLIFKLSKYDLILYLENDVKWVQDGTRTFGEDKVRQKNNELLKQYYKNSKAKYKEISGDYDTRYSKSIKCVDELLNK